MRHNVVSLFDQDQDQPPSAGTATRFEEVWKRWPTKAKKPLARAKYEALLKGTYKTRTFDKDSGQFVEIELRTTEDEIIAGIDAYLKTQKATGSGSYGYKDDGKYIPHLATFLNQGRFLDCL